MIRPFSFSFQKLTQSFFKDPKCSILPIEFPQVRYVSSKNRMEASRLMVLARSHEEDGNLPEAIKIYEKTIKVQKQVFGPISDKGNEINELGSFYRRQRDHSKAVDFYRLASAMNHGDFFYNLQEASNNKLTKRYSELSGMAKSKKKYIQAIENQFNLLQIKEALGKETSSEQRILGDLFLHSNRQNVKKQMKKRPKGSEKYSFLCFYSGETLLRKKKPLDAIPYFREAIESKGAGKLEHALFCKKLAGIHHQLGCMEMKKNRTPPSEAISHFEQELKLYDRLSEVKNRSFCHSNLSKLYEKSGDNRRAVLHAQACARLNADAFGE